MRVNDDLINNTYYLDSYQPGIILREFFDDHMFRDYKHGITSFSNPRYSNLTGIEFGIWKKGVWTRTHIDKASHVGIQTYNMLDSTMMKWIDQNYEVGIQRKISRKTSLMFVVYPISRLEGKINKDIIRELFKIDYRRWKRFHDDFPKSYPYYPPECISE